MLVRSINTGSDIFSIIRNIPDGKMSSYIIADNPCKELERLAFLANKKIDDGGVAYLKVKFEWELGARARILEVVGLRYGVLTIYKFVTISNFDQHAYDLERIKEYIHTQLHVPVDKVKCCMVTLDSGHALKIREMVAEMGMDIDVEIL